MARYIRDSQPRDFRELHISVTDELNIIQQNNILPLAKSMKQGCQAVINANGESNHFWCCYLEPLKQYLAKHKNL